MKIDIHFCGFTKLAELPEAKTSINKFTDFIAVPVDLSFTAQCLVKALRKKQRVYNYPALNFISSGYDVVDLRRVVDLELGKILIGAPVADLKKPLRSLYGDDIFACSEPVALYRFEFTQPEIKVVLHDTVPTME